MALTGAGGLDLGLAPQALGQGHATAQPCMYGAVLPGFGGARTKTCAQCGTSRTPQWREGPDGPKTLCNACGVKLVRANAKQKDGLKRRAAAAGGAGACAVGGGHGGSGPRAVAPAPVARPAVLPKPEAGSPTSDGGAARARNSALAAARRPQRKTLGSAQAAAIAASRTAEFATMGGWVEEDVAHYERGVFSRTTASASDCSAAGMSDAAEEVAWPALRVVAPHAPCGAARARAGGDADDGPLSPALAAVGSETAAAVNLLSMSVRDSDLPVAPADCGGRQGPGARAWAGARAAQPARPAPEGAAAAGAAAAAAPDARTYAPADVRAAGRSPAAERCARGSPAAEAAGRAPAAPACSDRYGWGPPPLAADEEEQRLGDPGVAAAAEAEGAALLEARDGAAREAAAADAAVAAVAKILAVKQAAATRARAAAAAAAQSLEAFLARTSLDGGRSPHKKAR